MAYYNVCPDCGSNLDPGERCDCKIRSEQEKKQVKSLFKKEEGSNQMTFNFSMEREKI